MATVEQHRILKPRRIIGERQVVSPLGPPPPYCFIFLFPWFFFRLSLVLQHILCPTVSLCYGTHIRCTNLYHFQFLLVNYWTWRDCCWISHAMYPSCYKKSKQYLHKRTYVRFYSMTGLQITVGHRTLAEQDLLMSDQSLQYRSNVSYHRRALRESRRALQESRRARWRRHQN